MTTFAAMFRNGENSLLSAEWEFLDNPAVRSWRNMLEHTLENPKENPLSLTDAVFCGEKDEAVRVWNSVRNKLSGINHIYTRLAFPKLKAAHCSKLLADLFKLHENGLLGNIGRSYEIKSIIDDLKKVMFYLDKVADNDYNNGNEASAFGQITVHPDPHFAVEFKAEWTEYLTMDIVPGTLYAELNYKEMAWHQILELGPIEQAYESIRNKRFDRPSYMGSGFYIPFHQDVAGVEAELIQYFYDHQGALKHLDPTFEPMYALSCSGRLPLATLKTKLGERGYPGYEDLKRIESLFKMESY